ncbi:MAG TPA: hypothetical protein PKE39_04280 [Ignavibacteria bacterium]|nr:hypothetical protein [Ignavibacteria bacterium]
MSYFATYEDVQKIGNLGDKVKQAVIEAYLPEAKADVIDRIGEAKYEEIYALGVDDDSYKNVLTAEARFVLYYLIPGLNISTSGDGITKARGVGDGRKENVSELDINTIIQRHKDQAEKLLKPYAKTVDTDEDENPDILITPGLSFAALVSEDDV